MVATLSTTGGTSPFTYNLEADETNGVDNASFKIDGSNVKVNTTPLTQKDYKINVKVTASVDGGATNTVYTESFDPETKSTTFELQGYEKATLHIYINDKLTKEQNITF